MVARLPGGSYYWHPRWSPDARFIAFQRGDGVRFDVFVVPAAGGEPRQVTHDNTLHRRLSWLPDGRGIVYSSSRGSTMPYLPTFSLWKAGIDGGAPTPVDLARDLVHASRTSIKMERSWSAGCGCSSIYGSSRSGGSGGDNVRRQPSADTPDRARADADGLARRSTRWRFCPTVGGHANIWVLATTTGELRQITHERDPDIAVGVPIWSPDGGSIAFVSSRGGAGLGFGIWLVIPDGGNLRQLVASGLGAAWSPDGRWLYYVERASGALKKVPRDGGTAVTVRPEGARNVIGLDGSTLYYLDERPLVDGTPEFLIRAATPENGPSRVLARVPASRVASWQIVNPALSPDGSGWHRRSQIGLTTNIWAVSDDDRRVAPDHRLRRSGDLHRPPRLLVSRRAVRSGRRR